MGEPSHKRLTRGKRNVVQGLVPCQGNKGSSSTKQTTAQASAPLTRGIPHAAEERLANDPTHELWGEHRSRYREVCLRFDVAGMRVLDIACGSGFGVQMLGNAGARVIGIDLDVGALRETRRLVPRAAVARADGARLPLSNLGVDLVASFETIEHVPDAEALVSELARVLSAKGSLVLSTPNRLFGPAERHSPAHNPFHVREFSAEELETLLRRYFATVAIHGQRPHPSYRYVPYLMLPDAGLDAAALPWKIVNRLPFGFKDRLARTLSGRSWYPSEHDYAFTLDNWDGAHALLAIASSPR